MGNVKIKGVWYSEKEAKQKELLKTKKSYKDKVDKKLEKK